MSDKTLGAYERHETPDDMDGGVTAALIEKEADGRMLGLEFRARFLSDDRDHWKGRAEKAEQERDEARADCNAALRREKAEQDRADRARRERDVAVDSALFAAAPRPLGPEDITDEMVERAWGEWVSLDDRDAHSMRLALRAALTETPARPDGAEEIEALIETSPWHLAGSCSAEADWLAERGVRVVTEEQP